ncbi:hypothetical protein [Streptacidiphilus rugosus]|uniref:hypothetical protein n=1 Tax=Streptacidiphilus rugosus TaxID=405783 RepID=UPI00056AFD24|nr:hypothetical protein [Streptacidiphilus rugosus]
MPFHLSAHFAHVGRRPDALRSAGSERLGPKLVPPLLIAGFITITCLAITVNPVIFPVGVIILMPVAVLIGLTV